MDISKIISALILTTFLLGCPNTSTTVKNPTPKDIEGVWEALYDNSVTLYLLLRMNDKGIGKVIGAGDEDTRKIFDLHSFKTLKSSFVITAEIVTEEESEKKEVMTFEGKLSGGLLCFAAINSGDEPEELLEEFNICFVRLEKLAEYRRRALAIQDVPLLSN